MKKAPYWFTDEEYVAILDNLVIVCVDTLLYDSKGRIYLGKRNRLPLIDWWIFGGRMQSHENYVEAAQRGLGREVNYVPNNPPECIGYYDLQWDTRQEAPQENGCHVLLAAMKCNVEDSEIDVIQAQGVDHTEGRWFTRSEVDQLNLDPRLRRIIEDGQVLR